MEIQGGWRERIIWESCHRAIHKALEDLGWFQPLGSPEKPIPSIVWRTQPYADEDLIEPNAIIFVTEDTMQYPLETGSSLTEDTTQAWVDFYPVDDALGRHVIGDLRAVLSGKMLWPEPGFMVLDHRPDSERGPGEPAEAELFWVEIENIEVITSVQNPSAPEKRRQRSLAFNLVDECP